MRYCGESTNEHIRVFVASTDRKWRMELIRLSSNYAALHVFMICWCNEKDLSKIIPRFLSDLLNSIGMPFIKMKVKHETYLSVVWLSVLLPFVMVHLKFVA